MTSNNSSKPNDEPSELRKEDGEFAGFEQGSTRKKKTAVLTVHSGAMVPPLCQVENCGVDLSNERYYRRHKVCQVHAKDPVVILAGTGQRFCQQCSRFHEVTKFDKAKRSCRRRLAGHNERRRKCSSDTHREASSIGGSSPQLKAIPHKQADNRGSAFPGSDKHFGIC